MVNTENINVPYEVYIRFLATRGMTDLNDVNSHLSSIGLPTITQDILDRAWNLIHSVMPKGIISQIESKLYSGDFIQSMGVLEVAEFWLVEEPFCGMSKSSTDSKTIKPIVSAVKDYLNDLNVKFAINALLIKNEDGEKISRALATKFSISMREKHVEIYRKYFFDPKRMRRSDWKRYLKELPPSERKLYFTALTEPLEVLKTELNLPATISVSNNLQWLLSKSIQKAKVFIDAGSAEANHEARAWIDQVVKLTDKYEKYRSGDQNDFSQALQMEFDFLKDEFDTPEESICQEVAERNKVKDQ